MTLQIRSMLPEDVEVVAALAQTVWQDAYPDIISQAQIDYMLARRYEPDALRVELITGSACWVVLLVDGEITGFASCHLTGRPGEMKLDKLYVHPGAQRMGYGAQLVERVADIAREKACQTLCLAVNKRNNKAISAYNKYGFSVHESVVKDIGNGFVMDDFIMTKSIL